MPLILFVVVVVLLLDRVVKLLGFSFLLGANATNLCLQFFLKGLIAQEIY